MNFHLVGGFTMRYFIYLAYDGTNYHGWQIQPNGDSVQETVMRALSTFLRQEIEVVGAGRTDAGVHATGTGMPGSLTNRIGDCDVGENAVPAASPIRSHCAAPS